MYLFIFLSITGNFVLRFSWFVFLQVILSFTPILKSYFTNQRIFEPTTGFEPVTSSLPRKCSTAELRRRLERVMGIEPTSPAWKAGVLPLNYTRKVGREGFEPPKAYAGRFTVCSLWPLGHLPLNHNFSKIVLPSHREDSNLRPTDYKSVALPTELRWQFNSLIIFK